ncbi:MAG: helicase-related protein, partial [Verrucomicrobia bacterium]|nr:helicase-related protein [Verrucomicrobiota bacterium]
MSSQTDLPIQALRGPLAASFSRRNRLVLHAPTGSGKSTQVPQFLLDDGCAGEGQIVVLQPRRVAARMLSRFVARQRGTPLGAEVGYQVRFENTSCAETRIKFETDGILLRQSLLDPDLSHVSVVVFDEFHERHLYGDVLLSRVKLLQETTRPDLKMVVMSATLDSHSLTDYLAPCATLHAEGRNYPVDIEYLPQSMHTRTADPWTLAVESFEQSPPPNGGHCLVFMPGGHEIRKTVEAFRNCCAAKNVELYALHGDLRVEEQDRALAPSSQPKIIVATNIAETSLTIPGVTLVIDSGLARKAAYDARRGINTLLIERISQASADQRAGRAGRTAPGRCVRLWCERDHRERAAQERPEIERLDLTELMLNLAALGADTVEDMPWLSPPPPEHVTRARVLLIQLGALSSDRDRITPVGRKLVQFPCHPRFASMLLTAEHFGCVPFATLVAALSQERSILLPMKAAHQQKARQDVLGEEDGSDVLLEVRAWTYAEQSEFRRDACELAGIHGATAKRVGQLHQQLLSAARQAGLDLCDSPIDAPAAARCLLAGFSDHVGRRLGTGTRYTLVGGRRASLAPDSAVRKADFIVATDIVELGHGKGEAEVRLARVTAIEPAWIEEAFPQDIHEIDSVEYDSTLKRVCRVQQRCFRDLMLTEKRGGLPDPKRSAEILAQEVLAGN